MFVRVYITDVCVMITLENIPGLVQKFWYTDTENLPKMNILGTFTIIKRST